MLKDVNQTSHYSSAYIVPSLFVIFLNRPVLPCIFDHMMVRKPYNLKDRSLLGFLYHFMGNLF